MVQLLLFLHVTAAIIAFGPIYAFPLIGAMGGKEPQHANFATRVSLAISRRRTLPFALTMPVTGILLVWAAQIQWTQAWLLGAIALYVIAIGYSILVQIPAGERVVAMTSAPPPAVQGGASGGPGGPGGGPGGPAGGPPPELRAAIRRVQLGGMFLSGLVVVIVALMVSKPLI